MSPGPAPNDPDPDLDQALADRDEAWEAWLASRERCEDDEPPDLGEEGDYHDDPDELAEIIAEARQASADQAAAEANIAASGQTAALAAGASVAMGRRGPGMPGSAEPLAGEYSGPGGAFATGQALDVAPGGPVLLGHADWAAGDDDRFGGVSDDKLPGTMALFRVGVISRYKAQVISHATQLLDPAEARAAEAMVLDRAGRLTPGALRAAIARAVMKIVPEKARKRREKAAKSAEVQWWAEFSGNAALMGRELPPAEVLAAGQRIDSWAGQLKAAGLEGPAGRAAGA